MYGRRDPTIFLKNSYRNKYFFLVCFFVEFFLFFLFILVHSVKIRPKKSVARFGSEKMGDHGLSVRCIPQFPKLGRKVRATDFTVDVHARVPESEASASAGVRRAPVDLVCVIDRSGSMSGS